MIDNASIGDGRIAAPDMATAKAGIDTAKKRRDLVRAGFFSWRFISK
ncbi:MAG: hypothetical protein ACYC3A_01900 [Halothiobacillus sp.]